MFPWLAFGHISPHVELAKKLFQNNFQIFLCSSPVNLQSIQSKLPQNCSSSNNNNNSIELNELNLPSLPELPPHMHTTNGLPLHLNSTLHKAFAMAAPEFHSILQKLNPHLLITELLQPWAIESASSLNIPVIPFFISCAGVFSQVLHWFANSDVEFPFPELDVRHNSMSTTPQLKILSHSSVGGFVFHCGWSSIVEAVVSGVPIIAVPMQVDHPLISRVAVAAGVAIEVVRGVNGAIERQGVANAIKQVLFHKLGEEFNKKAKVISENLKFDEAPNIQACVAELDQLCETRPVRR